MHDAQSTPHGYDPIEREIEDAVGGFEALTGKALAGFGGSGDENGAAGELRFQALDKGLRRKHFADGNGVDPNRAGVRWPAR